MRSNVRLYTSSLYGKHTVQQLLQRLQQLLRRVFPLSRGYNENKKNKTLLQNILWFYLSCSHII